MLLDAKPPAGTSAHENRVGGLGSAVRAAPVRGEERASRPRSVAPEAGGRDRDRTCDPYHVKVVLYR